MDRAGIHDLLGVRRGADWGGKDQTKPAGGRGPIGCCASGRVGSRPGLSNFYLKDSRFIPSRLNHLHVDERSQN